MAKKMSRSHHVKMAKAHKEKMDHHKKMHDHHKKEHMKHKKMTAHEKSVAKKAVKKHEESEEE